MPQLDRTGPEGEGAMTGRKAGRCTNFGAGKAKKGDTKAKSEDAGSDVKGTGQGRTPALLQQPGPGPGL